MVCFQWLFPLPHPSHLHWWSQPALWHHDTLQDSEILVSSIPFSSHSSSWTGQFLYCAWRITFLLSIFLFYIIVSPFSICIIHSRNMYFVLLTFVPFEESKRLKVSLNESEHLSCLSSSILVFSSLFPKQPGRLEQIQPRGASRVFRIKPNIYVGSWGSHDPVACCVSNFISCPTSHCCEVPATLGFFQFLKYTDAFLPLRLLLVFCTSAPWAYFSMVIPLYSLPQI